MKLSFRLKPIPPFSLALTAWALRRRPENIVDGWRGGTYGRVLVLSGQPVEVEVIQTARPEKPVLQVSISCRREIPRLRERVSQVLERMLGLRVDLSDFYRVSRKERTLRNLSERFLGLKPPRFPDLFESLVNAFACQQLSLHVGILLLNRLAKSFGISSEIGTAGLYSFALPERLATADSESLKELGFSRQKIRSLAELSQGVTQRTFNLDEIERLGNQGALKKLYELRGVGRWTAEYVLLRGLGRTDVFPGDDVGAQNKLRKLLRLEESPDYEQVQSLLSRWKPFAGLIYFHLLLAGLEEEGYV